MMKEITLGQFFPGKSILHRMDPRMKIILLIAFIAFIFAARNFAALGLISAAIFAVICLSGVSPKMYFKSVKAIIFIVLLTAGLNLFYGSGEPIWELGVLKITQSGINTAIFIAVRIISLVLISAVLTYTTSPTDLTDAIERLLKPLSVLHIQSAQKARGADFESGNFLARLKSLIPILIPLFVSAFRRAFELAMAMESRCYHGGEGRTRMKVLKYTKYDYIALSVSCVVFAGVIICSIFLPTTVRTGI